MTSPTKSRRRKAPEALNWRELAEAPALRGLAEVLSTTPEAARERSAKHLAVESQEASVQVLPTVGDSPSVDPLVPCPAPAIQDLDAPIEMPTVGVMPIVAISREALAVSPTVGVKPTTGYIEDPTVDEIPTVGNTASVGVPPTVVDTPTAGAGAWWVDSSGKKYEAKRVQRVVIAQHSMSLGEERVYQTLWHAREADGVRPEGKRSKTFSLGYDRLAALVRLNEKSVRLLLPKLISKRILEVLAAENSSTRTGRSYRIFSYEEILERQRAAKLEYIVKSGRAVEFVWPNTTVVETPTVVISLPATLVTPSEVLSPTVGVTPAVQKDSYPSDLAAKVRFIIPSFDEEALRRLWRKCLQYAPDCTSEEVDYCFQLKAQQLLGSGKGVANPVGLMLWAVPKCFEGPNALHLTYRERKRAEEELRRQAESEYLREIEEYRRKLADPDTSAEDRAWYQELLSRIQ